MRSLTFISISFRPLLATAVALLALFSGCGSGDSGSLTKVQYVQRADAMCRKINEQRDAAIQAYVQKRSKKGLNEIVQLGVVTEAALPPLETEAEKLEELGLPEEGEAKAQAVIDALWTAIEETKKDPLRAVAKPRSGPFLRPSALAQEFGFEVCARYA